MSDRPTFAAAAAELDRPTYENLRRALELGRWPDGRPLEPRQRETCLEAVVTWELANLPPEQHSGFVHKGRCGSDEVTPVRILGDE
jgi:uncharacterized protein YeaC (DUF1315 family)